MLVFYVLALVVDLAPLLNFSSLGVYCGFSFEFDCLTDLLAGS